MSQHAHAAVIDRIGRHKVKSHYGVTDRAIQIWRKNGIPALHWNSFRLLAQLNAVSAAEISERPTDTERLAS